jgi:hypothetical protein
MPSASTKLTFCLSCLFLLLLALPTMAAEEKEWKRFRFELEGGPVWQAKNEVRIPGNTGTEFSFKDLIGSGPYAAGRFTLDWNNHYCSVESIFWVKDRYANMANTDPIRRTNMRTTPSMKASSSHSSPCRPIFSIALVIAGSLFSNPI